jgi:hypothetical protein
MLLMQHNGIQNTGLLLHTEVTVTQEDFTVLVITKSKETLPPYIAPVVFNLQYVYPQEYVKTSYGVCKNILYKSKRNTGTA